MLERSFAQQELHHLAAAEGFEEADEKTPADEAADAEATAGRVERARPPAPAPYQPLAKATATHLDRLV